MDVTDTNPPCSNATMSEDGVVGQALLQRFADGQDLGELHTLSQLPESKPCVEREGSGEVEATVIKDEDPTPLHQSNSESTTSQVEQEQIFVPRPPLECPEHPEGEAIRKQVEYYFSDENLPSDAHMLMKIDGSENKPVSIKHICGFPKMRRYKPYTSVVASLKKSTTLDVVENDKALVRRTPFTGPVTVAPQTEKEAREEQAHKRAVQMQANKPWLTKGMRRATGFEEYWADAPVTPAAFAQEQELYHSDIPFETRIETAISRYTNRRKFHQHTALIFNKFLKYGGIDGGQKQFGGGVDDEDLEERSAAEIAAINATHHVFEDILLSEDRWEVDFEGVAKGFLSSDWLSTHLRVRTQSDISGCINILRNFYNYILHHDVCPEYKAQIYAARAICDIAAGQLYHATCVANRLTGDFNRAVSRLHGGLLAPVLSSEEDWSGADNSGGSVEDSRNTMMAAIVAHGTVEQFEKADTSELTVLWEEKMSFEVTAVKMADAETERRYESFRSKTPSLKTTGKLYCRRWTYPLARYANNLEADRSVQRLGETFTLFWEDNILKHCFVGMKVEATLRSLDNGIQWLESVTNVMPSFFELLSNEYWEVQKAAKREKAGLYDDSVKEGSMPPIDEDASSE